MPRRLVVEIVGDTAKLERALKGSQSNLTKFKKVAAGAAIGAGAAVAYGLGKVAKIGWDEFNQGQKVAAQTNAVLKSTGGVANVTAKDVERLGVQLMKKSGIDDEVIKSGENMLLTFKNIRNEAGKNNDIFDQATKATLDLSVATGKDMVGASVMVGKALNDPVRGLTALRRVGVQFTDAQEEQIKKLVEAGDVMGAQKIILKELRTEFGGSAEAAGKTFGGQIDILRERFNNWAGDMVAKAIPILERFGKWLMPLVEKAVRFVGDVIESHVKPAVQAFADVIRENEPQLRQIWERITTAVRFMWKIVGPILKFLLTEVLPRYVGIAIKAIDKVYDAIVGLIDAGKRLAKWFRGSFVGFWKDAWRAVSDFFFDMRTRLISGFLDFALKMVRAADKAFGWLPGIGGKIDKAIRKIEEMRDAAQNAANRRYNIRFVTNAGRVKSQIEDFRASLNWTNTPRGVGDFGSFGLGRTSLVALGRQLQSMGFQVGEHPAFGGVSGVHVPGSYHYQGRALDINWPGGGGAEMGRLDWLYSRLQRMPGIKELLWRTAGHFDHLHVAMDRGGVVPGPRGAPVPVLAHGGETFIPTHRNGGGWIRPIQVNVQLGNRTLGSVIVDIDKEHRQQNGGRGLLG